MQFQARRLLKFGSKFIVSFAILALLWSLVSPFYNRLVISISALVLTAIENPQLTSFNVEGDRVVVYIQSSGSSLPIVTLTKEFYNLNYFSIIVLWALMLATPVKLNSKAALIFITTFFMIFFHILFLLVYLRILYIVKGITPSTEAEFAFYVWLRFFTTTGKYWFPLIIWALFTFRYWLPKPAAPAVPPSPQPQRHPKEARP